MNATVTRAPYKVVAYEPGAAHIVDRATGDVVGWVLSNFYGEWTPYVSAGNEYAEGHALLGLFRYRKDAAQRVWEASHG